MKILKFPDNFYWGTSISSHQTEGNNNNNWSEWEKSEKRIKELKKQGKNPDNFISGLACCHYHLYEQDFDLSKKLNNNALRFSIEWSRIEPHRGIFNQKEINHYKEVLLALRKRDIEPFVTIWHFTTPIWFEKLKACIEFFCSSTKNFILLAYILWQRFLFRSTNNLSNPKDTSSQPLFSPIF